MQFKKIYYFLYKTKIGKQFFERYHKNIKLAKKASKAKKCSWKKMTKNKTQKSIFKKNFVYIKNKKQKMNKQK